MITMYIVAGLALMYVLFLICDKRKATKDDVLSCFGMLCLQLGLLITG